MKTATRVGTGTAQANANTKIIGFLNPLRTVLDRKFMRNGRMEDGVPVVEHEGKRYYGSGVYSPGSPPYYEWHEGARPEKKPRGNEESNWNPGIGFASMKPEPEGRMGE